MTETVRSPAVNVASQCEVLRRDQERDVSTVVMSRDIRLRIL